MSIKSIFQSMGFLQPDPKPLTETEKLQQQAVEALLRDDAVIPADQMMALFENPDTDAVIISGTPSAPNPNGDMD